MKHNCKQVLIALDQLVYCFVGCCLSLFNSKITVYADMTISAQAYRLEKKGLWYGRLMCCAIDLLFRPIEHEHCRLSYESELNRAHSPADMRRG